MNKWLLTALLLIPHVSSAKDYTCAKPGYDYQLPKDLAAHPNYKIEWWYLTGHLKTKQGAEYGFQWTLFRNSLSPKAKLGNAFDSNQIYFFHSALTDLQKNKHSFFEDRSRGFMGEAKVDLETLNHKIKNATIQMKDGIIHLKNKTPLFAYDLKLKPEKPAVYHGKNNVSLKGPEPCNASQYISYTRLNVTGTLQTSLKKQKVTGTAWMDQEFSSSQLSKKAVGWDWFSIQMNNNTELMLYFLRDQKGTYLPYSSGTFVNAKGKSQHLELKDIEIKKLEDWPAQKNQIYPKSWSIKIKKLELDFIVIAKLPNSINNAQKSTKTTYYEGPAEITSQSQNLGQAYIELSGYSQDLKGKL